MMYCVFLMLCTLVRHFYFQIKLGMVLLVIICCVFYGI